jgi:hypothetical protein
LKVVQKDTSRYRQRQDFLNRIPKVQEIIPRRDKWDCIKLRSFCTVKETTE